MRLIFYVVIHLILATVVFNCCESLIHQEMNTPECIDKICDRIIAYFEDFWESDSEKDINDNSESMNSNKVTREDEK